MRRELAGLHGLHGWTRVSRATVLARRDAQVRRLVRHAYARVPHYRELLDRHGVRPDEVRGAADLGAIPPTSRRDLQELPADALVARGVDPARLIERRTSGASGRPLTIRRTWFEERLLGAYRWRTLAALGWRARDRHAEIEEVEAADPRDARWAHRALAALGLFRQIRLHALRPPDAILRALEAYAPQVLTGYAGVVARVARVALDAGPPRLAPRVVAVHSEVLTPHMRAQISAAFGAPVRVIYDSNECNVIAWECARSGALHTCDDTTVVELLDARGCPVAPGERGEVVLTALHSFAMPFLRYRLGDVATQGTEGCACGLPFGSIGSVQGRMFDYFVLPDGRLLHPYEIVAALGRGAPWLREYQLVQARRDLVLVRLAAAKPPGAEAVAIVRREVAAVLGPAVAVDLDVVEEIGLEPNAKFRVCRSLVASEYDGTELAR